MSNKRLEAGDAALSRRLGQFVERLDLRTAPSRVVARLQSCLLYNTAVALAGYDPDDVSQRAISAVHNAPGNATIWVAGKRRSPPDAAAVNAALITARGQNDTHNALNGHLGCMLVPAAVALAEARASPPSTLLTALLAGYEVAPRIAFGAADRTTSRGLRGTSLYGVFGVAAVASHILGLDAERTAHALGLAAQSAGGLLQCYAEGTPEWRWQVANATRSGIIAALLAEQGLAAATAALDGDRGFYAAYAGLRLEDPGWDDTQWEIDRLTFKPYPGCAINQLPVFQLLDALRQKRFEPAEVQRIVLYLHPADAAYPGVVHYGPFDSPGAAIMSAPFMLRLALERGTIRHRDFHELYGNDAIHERSRMIEVRTDSDMPRLSCRLEIGSRAGASIPIEPPDRDPLVFNWEQTCALAGSLAEDWPGNVSTRRLGELVDYVQGTTDERRQVAELAHILTITS